MEDPSFEHPAAEPTEDFGLSRRKFLALGTATVAAAVATPFGARHLSAEPAAPALPPPTPATETPWMAKFSLRVNGSSHALELDTRTTLLDALREHLHLTGSKKGCDHGQCGACTVLVNGERINSCLSLAIMHQADEVITIEGLGTPEKMHPMQASFVKCDGFQCGYCTPGQICSSVAMLRELKNGVPSHVTEDLAAPAKLTPLELRERMSGNICRCGAYSNIVEAIVEAAGATNAA